jgi:hypothetical protein
VRHGRWQLQVDSYRLGTGPVSLGLRVTFNDNSVVRSAPLKIEIEPPELTARASGKSRSHQDTDQKTSPKENDNSLVKLDGSLRNPPSKGRLTMTGHFTIANSGFYELVTIGEGELSLTVDSIPLLSRHLLEREKPRFIPLTLEQGQHELAIEYRPAAKRPYLKLVVEGDQVGFIPEVKPIRNTSANTSAAD